MRFSRLRWRWTLLVTVALPLVDLVGPLAAQVVGEDIEESALGVAPRFAQGDSDEVLRILLRDAQNLRSQGTEPTLALDAYDTLIDQLDDRLGSELSAAAQEVFCRALLDRAALHLELGDSIAATRDLGRILELDPTYRPDDGEGESATGELFAQLRRERIGQLRMRIEPRDLTIWIDGRPAPLPVADAGVTGGDHGETEEELAGRVLPPSREVVLDVLAGTRLIEARHPGYAPLSHEARVSPGQTAELEARLDRVSAVLRVATSPGDAEVRIDGISYGATIGQDPARPGFSASLVIEDVEPGLRKLEILKEGFKPYRAELRIAELVDYELPPVVLERQKSRIVLRDLPATAEVHVNGKIRTVDALTGSRGRLDLDPGRYRVRVILGKARMFSTDLVLADGQTVEVQVRLRPGLAFLGVLGDRRRHDQVEDLETAVRSGLVASGRWTLLDMSQTGSEVLEKAGLTLPAARRAASGEADAVDWTRVQEAAEAEVPSLVYLVAVLTDDLLGSEADVLVWTAAPGPARPDTVRVGLGQQSEIERLSEMLQRDPVVWRPWIGALSISSNAAEHPLVVSVVPNGPLAQAGARRGDRILSVAGVPVRSAADVERRVLAAESGETVAVSLVSFSARRDVQVTLGRSPLVSSEPWPGVLDSIAFTSLLLDEEKGDLVSDRWLLRLNRALVLIRKHDFVGAVHLLRDIEAPTESQGINASTANYWLGVALSALGPAYRDAARKAFSIASQDPEARLLHNDGPRVAPRAKARLAALGNGG